MSHVTCHMSHLKILLFFLLSLVKVVELVGGGPVIHGDNLSSLNIISIYLSAYSD